MKWMLDTNTCIYILKNRPASVNQEFSKHDYEDITVSSVTVGELRFGSLKSNHPQQNRFQMDGFLAPIEILPFDHHVADTYALVRYDLEKRGTPIGPLDTMIAAHALHFGLTLVTNNTREFERVHGLQLENWVGK